jgi:DNA-binding MarR family transcriptional regulator
MSASPDDCGRQVLEVVPLVMRAIRAEMRSHRASNISVPQFRGMAFLSRHEGASLSDVAEHVGLTLPSMSNMVDRLVDRGLVTRHTRAEDRRRLTLSLTRQGRTMLESARAATQSSLAARLAALSPSDRQAVRRAMELLRGAFTPGRQAEAAARR